MDLSTRLCQVSLEGHLGATSGPNPQLDPLRVDPTRPFPPLGAGGGAVREGGHAPETRARRLQPPQHIRLVRSRAHKIGGMLAHEGRRPLS